MKKQDILEKGAIIQQDQESYAIAPHIPGGLVDVSTFRKVAEVAEKYNAVMKITSAQRIAVIGLKEETIDAAWKDLEMSIGYAIGVCVRMIKFCPGTTYCRRGKQDAVGVGLRLDKLYHGFQLPAKFKIGVSGCEYSCTAPAVKEIGLKGTIDGWTVIAGGNCGAKPRIGNVIAEKLTDDQAVAQVEKVVSFFKGCEWANKMRLARVVEKMGVDEFIKAVQL